MEGQNNSDRSYGQARSPARTEQVEPQIRSEMHRSQRAETERDPHYQSPSPNDIDFYIRKVNRLQNDFSCLQDQLMMARVRLRKAEDFQIKYDLLFKENQKTVFSHGRLDNENTQKRRQLDQLLDKIAKTQLENKNYQSQLLAEKELVEELRRKSDQVKNKVSNDGALEKAEVQESYQRQIEILKREAKDREQKLLNELTNAKSLNMTKDNVESSTNYKLQKIKADKDQEIDRLKKLTLQLRTELVNVKNQNDEKLSDHRAQLIQQTDSRIEHVRSLTRVIEETLMAEIDNLNETIKKKDNQIEYLIESDRKFIEDNEELQHGLKDHINRLQDKIFVLQRQNQIELFKTIDRLRKQYEENINELNTEQDNLRQSHLKKVDALEDQIAKLREDNELLHRETKGRENDYEELAKEKEQQFRTLTNKNIELQSLTDINMQNYTTSMTNIQEQARAKLHDLHASINNKNTENQILCNQLSLKNQEITYLINEINHLREQNRQKVRDMEQTSSKEQKKQSDLISNLKMQIQQVQRKNHMLDSTLNDTKKQLELESKLLKEDLTLQKEANQTLNARNAFLAEWCKELENKIKKERISNVDVLHDQATTRRETIQIRQQVRVEMRSIKDKQLEQIRKNFKLQENKLKDQLNQKERDLRAKKEEINRLMVEYKNLEKKVGRVSKFDKGSEENGKCQATLEAEILLTENIYNAINRP